HLPVCQVRLARTDIGNERLHPAGKRYLAHTAKLQLPCRVAWPSKPVRTRNVAAACAENSQIFGNADFSFVGSASSTMQTLRANRALRRLSDGPVLPNRAMHKCRDGPSAAHRGRSA